MFTANDTENIIYRHVQQHQPPILIAKDYNCSVTPITRLLKQRGVYRAIGTRKYFFDEEHFAVIDTPRKAYWLGFFYADGSVGANGTFTLGLKRSDRYILEALAEDVGYDGSIYDADNVKSIGGRKPKAYPSSTIALCSKQFAAHLIDKGIVPDKTFRLKLPDISPSFRRHFIRGLFDGDGFIHLKTNRHGRTHIVFGIVGQKQLLDTVNQIVAEEVCILPVKVHRKQEENCWVMQYSTSTANNVRRFDKGRLDDILLIREWLYGEVGLFLYRKKIAFDRIAPVPTRSGLSLEQAAEHAQMDVRTLRRYVMKGYIPSYKEGMYRRLRPDDVEQLKRTRESSDIMPWDKRLDHVGEKNQSAKLTGIKVREIRTLFRNGQYKRTSQAYKAAGLLYGVTGLSVKERRCRKDVATSPGPRESVA